MVEIYFPDGIEPKGRLEKLLFEIVKLYYRYSSLDKRKIKALDKIYNKILRLEHEKVMAKRRISKYINNIPLIEFRKITIKEFDGILPKNCEICGSTENLEIHHKNYSYPIIKEDLARLCKSCHSKITYINRKFGDTHPVISYGKC